MNRHAVQTRPAMATPKAPQLAGAAHGMDEADAGDIAKQLEQRPVTRADRDALAVSQPQLELCQELSGEPGIPSLQIEDELRLPGAGFQQLSNDESWPERVCQPPPVPQDRNRA